ncbi:hypothetical protein N431DRAFT_441901 [Stipitochalara longipes BDJ]|nr:hypothetical protein N431DRAFT_441901 [Stipitochalara longipes BDJ]
MKSLTFSLLALITTQYSSVCLALPSTFKYVGQLPVAKQAAPVVLGSASTFGALGATTLTSTGQTVITGDAGIYPGTSITGFPPGVITGTESTGAQTASGDSARAQSACLVAYNNAAGLTPTKALTNSDLTGLSLPPGVYTFPAASATLTGTVTLNGASNSNGQWIFQISSTFITAASSSVVLTNGAKACNVYFIVGSSATLGASTKLIGNVLAYTSISVDSAASNKVSLGKQSSFWLNGVNEMEYPR